MEWFGNMPKEDILYQILTEIDRNPSISQKGLSQQVGISVGGVNWHIKRCVSKGLLKLQQAPLKRYLYYLTPEGLSEKARLTAEYLHASFHIFRVGWEQYQALMELCLANGWSNIVLAGDSDLTELATLVAARFEELNIFAILEDEGCDQSSRRGLQCVQTAEAALALAPGNRIDAVIVCKFNAQTKDGCQIDRFLCEAHLNRQRLLIPGFLQ